MGSVSSCARCCTVRLRVAVQGLSECWRTAHEGVGQGAVSGRLALLLLRVVRVLRGPWRMM